MKKICNLEETFVQKCIFSSICGLTAHKVHGLLEDITDRAADVVLFPPEDDEVTDEESDGEDDLLAQYPNHLGKGVLSQLAELAIYSQDEEQLDVVVFSATGDFMPADDDQLAVDEQPGPSTRRSRTKRARLEVVEEETEDDQQR